MHVRTLCLGILAFGEATGYEIKKMSEEGRFSHFIDASYGSIYPALTRLTEQGLVECREEQQSGKPDRKIYSITEAGRAAFVAALEEDAAPDRFRSEFLFIMLCAEFLTAERIEHAYDTYIGQVNAMLGMLREAQENCLHPGTQFCIGYGLAIYEAKISYLEANREAALELAGTAAEAVAGEARDRLKAIPGRLRQAGGV